MAPKAQSGSIIYVDRKVAEAEGINVDRLVAYYARSGIRLITEAPYWDDCEERWVCNGCKTAYSRDEEVWRRSTITPSGWQPLCRICEGTELSDDPERRGERLRARRANADMIRKKPGRPAADPSKARRVDLPAGEGRPARWRA